MFVGYGVAAKGGFYPHNAVVLAVGVGLVGAIAAVRQRPPAERDSSALVAFTVLGAALLASSAAHGWSGRGLVPALTLAVAISSFAAARAVVREGQGGALIEILAWAGAASGLVCLLTLAFHASPFALRATGIWRAGGTITYANGAGSLLALCAPAALVLVARRPRVTSFLALYLILAGAAATMSRGAFVSLAVTAACLVVFQGRGALTGAVRPSFGALVALAGLVPSMVSPDPQPLPAIAGLLAGGLGAVARVPRGLRRPLTALLLGGVAIGAAATVERWSSLLASRGSAGSGIRLATWEFALGQGSGAPLLGVGPGSFNSPGSRFAHNEYLQVFAETGLVGLTAVLLALALFARAVWRARPPRAHAFEWACSAGACAGFALHSGIDFLWRFPVLVMVVFVWLATATSRPDRVMRR